MVQQVGQVLSGMMNTIKILAGTSDMIKMQGQQEKAPVLPEPAIPQVLAAGQLLEAVVVAQKGDAVLLQSGRESFWAQAEKPLAEGDCVRLTVLEIRDGIIYMRREPEDRMTSVTQLSSACKRLLAKLGVEAEQEVLVVEKSLARIPGNDTTAVRYLLDPHLLAALFLPLDHSWLRYHKIEVSRYKSTVNKRTVWEIFLDLNFANLGHLEISIQYVNETVYTRIRSDNSGTEELLKENLNELVQKGSYVEVVPYNSGSLRKQESEGPVDVRI